MTIDRLIPKAPILFPFSMVEPVNRLANRKYLNYEEVIQTLRSHDRDIGVIDRKKMRALFFRAA